MPMLGAAMLSATGMAAQAGNAHPGGYQTAQSVSDNRSDAAACTRCHKELVKDFDSNPHSNAALKDPSKIVTCARCHGSGKAHAESGEVGTIFDPLTATGKQADEKCQACHDRHGNFEHSAHGKGNVSCIGCHTVHGRGASKHLLKAEQPQLIRN